MILVLYTTSPVYQTEDLIVEKTKTTNTITTCMPF